jgi:hypothetical protein
MIVVRLHGHQHFDVFVAETDIRDALLEQRRGVFHAGVDQDVTFGGSQQEHREVIGVDGVERSDDAVRLKRCPPKFTLGVGRRNEKEGSGDE